MSRDITPFALRMPPEMRSKVELAAKKNHRSLNAEISARLETTFALDDHMAEMRAGSHADVSDMIDSIIAENSRFQGAEQKLTELIKAELASLIDSKLEPVLRNINPQAQIPKRG